VAGAEGFSSSCCSSAGCAGVVGRELTAGRPPSATWSSDVAKLSEEPSSDMRTLAASESAFASCCARISAMHSNGNVSLVLTAEKLRRCICRVYTSAGMVATDALRVGLVGRSLRGRRGGCGVARSASARRIASAAAVPPVAEDAGSCRPRSRAWRASAAAAFDLEQKPAPHVMISQLCPPWCSLQLWQVATRTNIAPRFLTWVVVGLGAVQGAGAGGGGCARDQRLHLARRRHRHRTQRRHATQDRPHSGRVHLQISRQTLRYSA
jgi:hypothetical protein